MRGNASGARAGPGREAGVVRPCGAAAVVHAATTTTQLIAASQLPARGLPGSISEKLARIRASFAVVGVRPVRFPGVAACRITHAPAPSATAGRSTATWPRPAPTASWPTTVSAGRAGHGRRPAGVLPAAVGPLAVPVVVAGYRRPSLG